MVQSRKERKAEAEAEAEAIRLQQPDRSGPTEKTLLDFARERDLFAEADARQRKLRRQKDGHASSDDDDDGEDHGNSDEDKKEAEDEDVAGVDRVLETILWTLSLAMLHFTLDVLVQHQFATELSWREVTIRTARAFGVLLPIFYVLHPHASSPTLIPGLPARYQATIRQSVFFVTSVVAGCFLIYISNMRGYLAIMKQAPPLGCVWVWSVIELELSPATVSLAITLTFFWLGGFKVRDMNR